VKDRRSLRLNIAESSDDSKKTLMESKGLGMDANGGKERKKGKKMWRTLIQTAGRGEEGGGRGNRYPVDTRENTS